MHQRLLSECEDRFREVVVLNQEFFFCLIIAISKVALIIMSCEKWSIREPIAHTHRWKWMTFRNERLLFIHDRPDLSCKKLIWSTMPGDHSLRQACLKMWF